jgi:uncharacterized protein (UPF0179 family)
LGFLSGLANMQACVIFDEDREPVDVTTAAEVEHAKALPLKKHARGAR